MVQSPLILIDSEKCLLSVSADVKGPINWATSNAAQVGIEPVGDGHTAYATTPLESGTATITVSARGYETDTKDVTYTPGIPGKLNLSAGVPEPD